MKNEKTIAIIMIVGIIIAVSALIVLTNEDIFGNLFEEPISDAIEMGDCADVNYIGYFESNDTVFDTSYESTAIEAGIYNENLTYEPGQFFVDLEGNYPPEGYDTYYQGIPGFTNGLIGMKKGENKTITIPPEDAYGDWNVSLAEELFSMYFGSPHIPRISSMEFTTTMLNSTLLQFNATINISNLTVNQTFDYIEGESQTGETVAWQIKITNISDQNVTIEHIVENGTIFKTEGVWDNIIVVDNETHFSLRAEPELNAIYGEAFSWMKVVDFNDTDIIIALNIQSPEKKFVNQTLVFYVEVEEVYKTSLEES